MPANLGYMSAMLYNQNNCASEGSTVTSKYEMEVGRLVRHAGVWKGQMYGTSYRWWFCR